MIQSGKEKQIIEMWYVYKRTKKDIARELELPYSVVDKFLVQHELKNYKDNQIESLARNENYNSLSVINTFFDAAGHMAQELAFVALVAKMLREEIAQKLADGGVAELFTLENKDLLNSWYENTEKMTKLAANAPKQLETYVNLYTTVLDIQRSVSYVKVMDDALKKADANLHKILQDSLSKDTAARAVFAALDPEQIANYWGDEISIPGKALKNKKTIDEDK